MSQTPYLLPRARWGYRPGHDQVVDGMYRDGFLCPLCGFVMGETAGVLAERYGVTRVGPELMGIGPVPAVRRLLEKTGLAPGHPIGATGARLVVTLTHAMERRDADSPPCA